MWTMPHGKLPDASYLEQEAMQARRAVRGALRRSRDTLAPKDWVGKRPGVSAGVLLGIAAGVGGLIWFLHRRSSVAQPAMLPRQASPARSHAWRGILEFVVSTVLSWLAAAPPVRAVPAVRRPNDFERPINPAGPAPIL
jgi:hypothetical protein